MEFREYESPRLELILAEEDILTASGDNYEDDPWGDFEY